MVENRKSQRPLGDDRVRTAFHCALALAFVIAFGTLGFSIIEKDWTVWQAVFFTLITVTTVGYGDQGMSPEGEAFAAVLLLLGIGTATYSLSSFVQIAISYQTDWKKKMQKKVDALKNHFLICGYGRMGHSVCEELHAASVPLVVIDCDTHAYESAVDDGFLALLGNSADEDVLIQAGIRRARGVICNSGADAENLFITLTARELNKDAYVVSRASTVQASRRMERAGASLVVSPYVTAGMNVVDAILRPKLAEFLNNTRRRGCDFELTEFTVPPGSSVIGKAVKEVGIAFPSIVFVALNRPGEAVNVRPGGTQTFEERDAFTIAGHPSDLEFILEEVAAPTAAPAEVKRILADELAELATV